MSMQFYRFAAAAVVAISTPAMAQSQIPTTSERAIIVTQSTVAEDEVLWMSIKDTGYPELFGLFLNKYPDSQYAPEARTTLASLAPENASAATQAAAILQEGSVAPPPVLPAPVLAAPVLASPVLAAPQQTASIANQPIAVAPPIEQPIGIDIARLQRDLANCGCNPGRPDGEWGPRSANAGARFVKQLGLYIEGGVPSPELAQAAAAAEGDICGDKARLAAIGAAPPPRAAAPQFVVAPQPVLRAVRDKDKKDRRTRDRSRRDKRDKSW